MAKRTPPFLPFPEWSTAKFFGFIRSGLREKFNRWPPKYNRLKQSSRIAQITGENGEPVVFKTGKRIGEVRTVKEYQCAGCNHWFKQKQVQVDHIIPAGSLKGFNDIASFTERLFVGEDSLQVLCSTCHTRKTQKEKE
jgi:5-methylcytosine-specific restriction endonuclease McrA